MNSEHIKNNDPLQLQQMIIFLKAELAKYKHEVQKYKDSYHYSLVERFEEENEQLTNEKNALIEELQKIHKEFNKKSSEYEEQILLLEMQRKEYSASIATLQKTNTDLWTTNKQLTDVIQNLKDGLDTDQHRHQKHDKQVASLHRKIADYKKTVEQLEYKLVHLIQEANQQVYSQLEKLDLNNKERTQSEKVHQYLLQELEEKNHTIKELQHKFLDLKEQHEQLIVEQNLSQKNDIPASIDSPTIDAETLLQLDKQIAKILAQSLEYEEKLDAKLLVLNTLEHKLDQLTVEIDDIKIFSVEGQITKER